jgi:hypothetical protein
LLAGELPSPLRYLTLGAGLLSMDTRSLSLLKSVSSLKGEAGVSHGTSTHGGAVVKAMV